MDTPDPPSKKQKPANTGPGLKRTMKKKKNEKAARLVVRNLSFKITKESMLDHFSQFGKVEEVTLLKRGNKLVGCGFVQYENKMSAAKAIANTSGKPLLDRIIVVDWAVPKKKFMKIQQNGGEDDIVVKKESDEEEEEAEVVPSEDVKVKEESDDSLSSNTNGFKSDGESGDDEDSSAEMESSPKISKTPRKPDDLSDGRTLFIKNIPFSVTNDELKKCMQKFGEVIYALVCVDRLTEHSRGTGFVKFKTKEHADLCLNAGTSLTLKDTILDVHVALPKDKLPSTSNKNGQKDNRNLILAKEGVILASTPAAVGVSQADMTKRVSLELWKTQKLRNLSMFVSRTRLIIHNLPENITDKKLFSIFKEHCPGGTIREARVMRNLREIGIDGRAKSKGYGFVAFTRHEDALLALRSVNNNPKVFTKTNRPIVFFSIENKAALKLKERRQAMSRNKRRNSDNESEESDSMEDSEPEKKVTKANKVETEPTGSFVGLVADGGKNLFKKHLIKKQVMAHAGELRRTKKNEIRKKKAKLVSRGRRRRRFQIDVNRKKNSDHEFTKLVNKYKIQLCESANKKRWFD